VRNEITIVTLATPGNCPAVQGITGEQTRYRLTVRAEPLGIIVSVLLHLIESKVLCDRGEREESIIVNLSWDYTRGHGGTLLKSPP